ncbi:MAG: hypothetical protein PHS19_03230 [Eubacteriales bacterium]|nr:hypothetical protein [Eubacteriales bacterium]
MMLQKKIQTVLVILLLNLTCFLAVMIATAYLVAEKEVNNTFTVGNNETAIIEDYEEVSQLNPGDIIRKAVTISNIGNNSCYIRVLSLFSDSDAEGYARLNYNEEDWELKDDGYFYYRSELAPGSETSELFSRVEISSEAEQEQIKGFNILIYAESVNVEAGGFS